MKRLISKLPHFSQSYENLIFWRTYNGCFWRTQLYTIKLPNRCRKFSFKQMENILDIIFIYRLSLCTMIMIIVLHIKSFKKLLIKNILSAIKNSPPLLPTLVLIFLIHCEFLMTLLYYRQSMVRTSSGMCTQVP